MDRSGARLLGAVVLGVLVVTGVAGATTAWLWSRDGVVRIEVDEGLGGDRVSLSAPAWLLRLGPLSDLEVDLDDEARRWLPAVRAALEDWEDTPDGVIVRTAGPDGTVVVSKHGPRVIVRLADGSDRVRIEIPARALARLVPENRS